MFFGCFILIIESKSERFSRMNGRLVLLEEKIFALFADILKKLAKEV
jgi:hypothetical protein